jgi:hypothetical protein
MRPASAGRGEVAGTRELLSSSDYAGSKTILDNYLPDGRPRYLPRPRTFQHIIYR